VLTVFIQVALKVTLLIQVDDNTAVSTAMRPLLGFLTMKMLSMLRSIQ
jgi:hypothetical protein